MGYGIFVKSVNSFRHLSEKDGKNLVNWNWFSPMSPNQMTRNFRMPSPMRKKSCIVLSSNMLRKE